MSTLFFDTVSARGLVRTVHDLATIITPVTSRTSERDDFTAALAAAIERTNARSTLLAEFYHRAAENSERIITHAELHDRNLGQALEELA